MVFLKIGKNDNRGVGVPTVAVSKTIIGLFGEIICNISAGVRNISRNVRGVVGETIERGAGLADLVASVFTIPGRLALQTVEDPAELPGAPGSVAEPLLQAAESVGLPTAGTAQTTGQKKALLCSSGTGSLTV